MKIRNQKISKQEIQKYGLHQEHFKTVIKVWSQTEVGCLFFKMAVLSEDAKCQSDRLHKLECLWLRPAPVIRGHTGGGGGPEATLLSHDKTSLWLQTASNRSIYLWNNTEPFMDQEEIILQLWKQESDHDIWCHKTKILIADMQKVRNYPHTKSTKNNSKVGKKVKKLQISRMNKYSRKNIQYENLKICWTSRELHKEIICEYHINNLEKRNPIFQGPQSGSVWYSTQLREIPRSSSASPRKTLSIPPLLLRLTQP
jgi:hypothetical protein